MPVPIRGEVKAADGRPYNPEITGGIWGYVVEPNSRARSSQAPSSSHSSCAHYSRARSSARSSRVRSSARSSRANTCARSFRAPPGLIFPHISFKMDCFKVFYGQTSLNILVGNNGWYQARMGPKSKTKTPETHNLDDQTSSNCFENKKRCYTMVKMPRPNYSETCSRHQIWNELIFLYIIVKFLSLNICYVIYVILWIKYWLMSF